jgi:hypothetical protein
MARGEVGEKDCKHPKTTKRARAIEKITKHI